MPFAGILKVMEETRTGRALILTGVAALALTVGVMARHCVKAPKLADAELRDAVASPVILGGVHALQPDAGYFAGPSGRRAEAERVLLSSRRKNIPVATSRRAAMRRQERALAVSAQ